MLLTVKEAHVAHVQFPGPLLRHVIDKCNGTYLQVGNILKLRTTRNGRTVGLVPVDIMPVRIQQTARIWVDQPRIAVRAGLSGSSGYAHRAGHSG